MLLGIAIGAVGSIVVLGALLFALTRIKADRHKRGIDRDVPPHKTSPAHAGRHFHAAGTVPSKGLGGEDGQGSLRSAPSETSLVCAKQHPHIPGSPGRWGCVLPLDGHVEHRVNAPTGGYWTWTDDNPHLLRHHNKIDEPPPGLDARSKDASKTSLEPGGVAPCATRPSGDQPSFADVRGILTGYDQPLPRAATCVTDALAWCKKLTEDHGYDLHDVEGCLHEADSCLGEAGYQGVASS